MRGSVVQFEDPFLPTWVDRTELFNEAVEVRLVPEAEDVDRRGLLPTV